ncbi:hypothetical protein M3J09_001145 [Ascochyta lentis]
MLHMSLANLSSLLRPLESCVILFSELLTISFLLYPALLHSKPVMSLWTTMHLRVKA